MASKKRNFIAGVPVALTLRFILRLPLLAQLELKELLLQLMVRYAKMCAVEILFYQLGPNHYHASVVQAFHGHDPNRLVGISPFVRNVMSVWVKRANSFLSTQGTLTERNFRSHNVYTNEELFANMAYTLGNETHHIGRHPEKATHSAWGVYVDSEPDGVVTAMPAFLDDLGGHELDELLLAITNRAIELELEGGKRAWLNATVETLALMVPQFPRIEFPEIVDIARYLDGSKHRQSSEQRLAWKLARVEFQPRRAPRIGELIEIVVRNQLDASAGFG